MWIGLIFLGLVSVCWGDGEAPCRVSESTLFCVGRWDGIWREGIEKVIVREWDRRWCGKELWEKAIIYGRACTCESVSRQCKETPFAVNGKECQERTTEELRRTAHQQPTLATGSQSEDQWTTIVTGSVTVTDRRETWAYAWIGGLGGLCVILVIVIVIVCKKKKLFFLCKPRTSPPPTRRDNVVFQLPRIYQDNTSDTSVQVYP